MSLHTRVIVKVIHPRYGFVQSSSDQGAKFRDDADIKRVTDQMVAAAQQRYGSNAKIEIETCEAG